MYEMYVHAIEVYQIVNLGLYFVFCSAYVGCRTCAVAAGGLGSILVGGSTVAWLGATNQNSTAQPL